MDHWVFFFFIVRNVCNSSASEVTTVWRYINWIIIIIIVPSQTTALSSGRVWRVKTAIELRQRTIIVSICCLVVAWFSVNNVGCTSEVSEWRALWSSTDVKNQLLVADPSIPIFLAPITPHRSYELAVKRNHAA